MNRQEFIQEAALRLITAHPDIVMSEVRDLAEELADYICPEEEQEPEVLSAFPDGESIQAVIEEVDRLDCEQTRKQKEQMDREWPHSRNNIQKSGYGIRVKTICAKNNIHTVKDLIDFGRIKFRAQRNMGEKCTEFVDKALMNLYAIRYW